jgi:putative salt-induced outer membrane protein
MLPVLSIATAQDPQSNAGEWSGEGALGFTSTSGNTDSENLNASLKASLQKMKWKHSASIEAIRNETDNETSADWWAVRGRSEYSLSEKSYSFGQARYEEDKFSGYEYQGSISFGLGSRFIDNGAHLLDLSAGVGYRSIKDNESGETTDEGILNADLKYQYKISESSTFSELAFIESGEENTYAQSETALTSVISGKLSSKISYLVKHNSDVPPDIEKTDKIFSISLVYGF